MNSFVWRLTNTLIVDLVCKNGNIWCWATIGLLMHAYRNYHVWQLLTKKSFHIWQLYTYKIKTRNCASFGNSLKVSTFDNFKMYSFLCKPINKSIVGSSLQNGKIWCSLYDSYWPEVGNFGNFGLSEIAIFGNF